MNEFIYIKNNCHWVRSGEDDDNYEMVRADAFTTAEEIINTEQLIKVFKYHDADENRIVYVWRDIVQDEARGHTCIREFHEMFDSELLRDVAFKRLVNRLERREP